jgi:hypothetical protein
LRAERTDKPFALKGDAEGSFSLPALYELMKAVNDKGLPFRFMAGGLSMSPFIKEGDVITISPISPKGPRLGDVVPVFFPDTGRLLIHRVVARRGRFCLIRGDNTLEPDGIVPATGISSRVVEVSRDGVRRSLGLGSDRIIVALLSRWNLLTPLLFPLWRAIPLTVRRWIL